MQPRAKSAIPAAPVVPKPQHAPLPPDVNAASFMRLPAVKAAAGGVSGSTIWTWCRQAKFPQPVRFGRITAWRAADVLAWLADPEGWRAAHLPSTSEGNHA